VDEAVEAVIVEEEDLEEDLVECHVAATEEVAEVAAVVTEVVLAEDPVEHHAVATEEVVADLAAEATEKVVEAQALAHEVVEATEVAHEVVEATEVAHEAVEVIEEAEAASVKSDHLKKLKKESLETNPLSEREMIRPIPREGPTLPTPLTEDKSKRSQTWSRISVSTTTSCS
jgi:6-phosphofructokinase